MTCREPLAGVDFGREGAKAAVERVFVGRTRRDAAAEGGGCKGDLVGGRGGGGIELTVGRFNDGGLLAEDSVEDGGMSFVDKSAGEDAGELRLDTGPESPSGE